ncbi:MAG: LON peptidase substrate-binding domain-containing protein [Myxococcales bacterium]|nr:LON peptidase substrate-binding domain-containing protein [Myxococcales bacterium]
MQRVPIVEDSYESLPVFPLPNFVLFPNTMTRLHVFEPRYRMLTADALAGERLVVLVGLKPGWEEDYYGSPPVFGVGSLCKIVNEERLEDGRYNLFMHCVGRVRIRTIHRLTPYRTAEVEVIPDHREEDTTQVDEAMTRLVGCVRGLILEMGEQGVVLSSVLTSTRKPDILTNRLAAAIATEPAQKQSLLETTSVQARAERLTDLSGELLLRSSELDQSSGAMLVN